MTSKDFNIKRIAIIGGGFSGLSTLNDLLHTHSSGHSTLSSKIKPSAPAFSHVELFEENSSIGGAWNFTSSADPGLPYQEILETKDYSDPSNIIVYGDHNDGQKELRWNNSGVYENLYTNISQKFMTLSSLPIKSYPIREFSPFLTHKEVLRVLYDLVETYDLKSHINLNSSVHNIIKTSSNEYQLTIKSYDPITKKNSWIVKTFDAIVIATGRFQYPHIPTIPNLPAFNALHPCIILHSKSFRNGNDYIGKKVLVVGASVSSLGIVQYLLGKAKEIHLSRRKIVQVDDSSLRSWYNEAFESPGVIHHGEILTFHPLTNEVEFKDGDRISEFDAIIFATGFHIHFPFLKDIENTDDRIVKIVKSNGEQRGYIKNLFEYIFTIDEPAIAHVGLTHSGFSIHFIESQGVAIAGVWSNAKNLPSVDDQRKWFEDRVKEYNGKRLLHHYDLYESKLAIEHLNKKYGPIDRPNVVERVDVEEFEKDKEKLALIFDKFAKGIIDESYVSLHDCSGL